MAAAIPYMAAGYVADRALGGNGMTGLTIGSLGAGAAGGFTMPSFSGSLGTGATAANSLGGGAALMGGTGTAVGTSGATTGILGSSVGNMGLENVTGGVTGQGFSPYATTDTLGQSISQVDMPVFSGMNSSIPNPNLGLDTSNSIKDSLTGRPVAPQYNSIPQLEEAPLYTGAESPDFANITKSSEKQIAAAQGGYAGDKPLYEKAFDSVMGYAEKNPLGVAALGMSIMGGGSGDGSATQGYAPSGGVSRQAYNQNKDRIMKIRRA
tara:strand:+ start:730 stop:1527 length:798 start_codon:yes stop_codon:yes gene_type:complete